MNTERTSVGIGFWLAWILASVIGFGLGGAFGSLVSWNVFPRDHFDVVIGISFGAVYGAIGGFAQWLVLRQRVTRAGLWIFASALSLSVAAGAAAMVREGVDTKIQAIIFGVIFGVTGGPLQWLILRGKVSGAGRWPVANLLGSLLSIALDIPVINAINAGAYDFGTLMLFGASFGAGLGVVTGALLRQSQSRNVGSMATAH